MTSNLGSQTIREDIEKNGGTMSDSQTDALKARLFNMLKQTIRPEFLNRIDDTIMFLPLTQNEIADVVRLQMNGVSRMLAAQGLVLKVTESAIDAVAEAGFDPEFGARPVKRAIQNLVLNDLSKKILSGDVNKDKPIIIDSFGEGLVFRN